MTIWPDEALERQMLYDADQVRAYLPGGYCCHDCGNHVRALLSRVRALEQREAELMAALKPLAYQAQIIDENDAVEGAKTADSHLFRFQGSMTAISAGNCRKASEALKEKPHATNP